MRTAESDVMTLEEQLAAVRAFAPGGPLSRVLAAEPPEDEEEDAEEADGDEDEDEEWDDDEDDEADIADEDEEEEAKD